jgi:uncharacterized protein (TIGR00645 family)
MPSESDGEVTNGRPDPPRRRDTGAERVFAASLRLIYIPVVVLLLAGLGAFVYGAFVFVHSLIHIVDHPYPVGHKIGFFLLVIDLFLIGATLLISAVGLFELFIHEIDLGERTPIPAWLEMRDLNDLKARVIAMIVLVLGVSFVEVVVDAPSGRQALGVGAGIAAVIVALTIFLRFAGHGGDTT